MVSKNTKMLLTIGAVIVGGYFLIKVIAPGMFGIYPQYAERYRGTGITLYPSMAPVGGPYPSPSAMRQVTVF